VIFRETKLKGAFLIELEKLEDPRGFFARAWCQKEFERQGLNPRVAQCNISFNERKGTLRGMHYQVKPFAEAKLVRCTRGEIYDMIVDLRAYSPTRGNSWAEVLDSENRKMLYIPEGLAHGFLTLAENTEVFYQMSEFYAPECARGFRWNDPTFDLQWPEEAQVISDRDRDYPDFMGEWTNRQ
jgi:dTDP-4-dehydrorhamnose 3,5-epimerase